MYVQSNIGKSSRKKVLPWESNILSVCL